MGLLDEKVKTETRAMFRDLINPVRLIVFTGEPMLVTTDGGCETCKDNRTLVEEIAALSERISVEIYDFSNDQQKAQQYGIDKIPATIIEGAKRSAIRFFGLPAGYEFTSLLQGIKTVSAGESELSDVSKEKLKALTRPVHIQVFVTLTCPYCPMAVHMAYQMAFENPLIRADAINAQEFMDFSQKYDVFTVPKIVINETTQFEGAIPEDAFIDKVLEAASKITIPGS